MSDFYERFVDLSQDRIKIFSKSVQFTRKTYHDGCRVKKRWEDSRALAEHHFRPRLYQTPSTGISGTTLIKITTEMSHESGYDDAGMETAKTRGPRAASCESAN